MDKWMTPRSRGGGTIAELLPAGTGFDMNRWAVHDVLVYVGWQVTFAPIIGMLVDDDNAQNRHFHHEDGAGFEFLDPD